ncbi:MAG: lactate utilization protein [Firmicutes bacterium]|nr:lactate utilization protein [Bacillota bacterium]
MDENVKFVVKKRVEKTIENLKKNNMKACFVEDEKGVIEKIKELLNDEDTVAVGGSMTLFETGVIDLLRDGNYNFLDRYEEGLKPEDVKEIYRKSFSADAYFSSSNAITTEGELYNVDGRGNRVSAMIYGPDKVIVVAGVNKIVKDLDDAIKRNREIAAPANTKRLDMNTPCKEVGYCMDCSSEQRICSDYVVMGKQLIKDRVHVIIVNKDLGY